MDIADLADKQIEDQLAAALLVMRHGHDDASFQGREVKGVCNSCGDHIPVARMKAVPGCRKCINCAERDEKIRAGFTVPGVIVEDELLDEFPC
ncbi:MAG: TraR/DksA C4-type zinc finger protein [Sedimenticola sp.]